VKSGSKSREIINYSFLSALADDGVIDQNELSYIKTLKRIFALVDEARLPEVARAELHKFRHKYNV
jgi:hypothetical protein